MRPFLLAIGLGRAVNALISLSPYIRGDKITFVVMELRSLRGFP
jgi:hypothetical protein